MINLNASNIIHTVPHDTIRKIYCVGIKGVGVAALALIAKEAGFEVRGCDVDETFITDQSLEQAGIVIDRGFDPRDIESFMGDTSSFEGLVIITGAHKGFENPVAQWAREHHYPVLTQGQAVGLFMDGRLFQRADQTGISVSGSHGKTTITAMCATVLQALEADPSYVIGTGLIYPLGNPGHFGTGHIFLAEADEYASDITSDPTPKLLYQQPHIAIINNIDFDHPDFYESVSDVEAVFRQFVTQLSNKACVIANGDDDRIRAVMRDIIDREIIWYGHKDGNDFRLKSFKQHATNSSFEVIYHGQSFGSFSLRVPGIHNAANALSVIAVSHKLGYQAADIARALEIFEGSKRRSEIIGIMTNGAVIIDDYAHHPQEIETTLSSLKHAYQDRHVTCIFQPHTHSRTKALLHEFADSLKIADKLILMPVFASAREQANTDEVSTMLYDELKTKTEVHFFEKSRDVVEYITQECDSPDSLIITMGAGNVYHIGRELLRKS